MKLSKFAFAAASALLCASVSAQYPPVNNDNDIPLNAGGQAGGDIVFYYNDPTTGAAAGAGDFSTNLYVWKIWPGDVMRSCTGTLEIAGATQVVFDTDFATVDGSGNNTIIPDWAIGDAVPGSNPGNVEPDQVNFVFYGTAGTPTNNFFITDPGCAPAGQVNGYEYQFDLTGGAGPGSGQSTTANGVAHTSWATFDPFGSTYGSAGPGVCGLGDGILFDLHNTDAFGIGDTQFDWLNTAYSAWGGVGDSGVTVLTDGVHESMWNWLSFSEPTLNMRVDSNTGQGLEDGYAGVHYDCPATVGGKLSAEVFATPYLGKKAAVVGSILPPLAACVNFKGGKLMLNPTNPLFNVFLGLWQGTLVQLDNEDPMTGTGFDDAEFVALALPLPAQLIPVASSVSLWFQGFAKPALLVGTNVCKITLHG